MEDTSERTLPEAPPSSPDQATSVGTPESHAAPNAAAESAPGPTASASSTEVSSAATTEEPSLPRPRPGPIEGSSPETQDEESDDSQDADDDSAEGEAGEGEAAADGVAGDGKTPAKRKRRRRRKRKDGSSAGDVVAADAGEASRPEPQSKKKELSHAPFAHRFGGAGGKRHAFAVGEVVAGRVQRVEHGVIVVDLFGKAIAMADEYEPRDIPPMPDPAALAEAQESQDSLPNAELAPAAASTGTTETTVTTVAGDDHAAAPVEPLAAAGDSQPNDVSSMVAAAERELTSDRAGDGADVAAEPSGELAAEPSGEMVASAEPTSATAQLQDTDTVADGATTLAGGLSAPRDETLDDDADDDHAPPVSIEPPREKPEPPALGQVFKGRVGAVSESGHIALLNRIIDAKVVREQLAHFREQHQRVHGMVYGYNRGGFDVLVEGLRAFCPASAMSLEDIADPLEFVGKKLEFLLPASKAGSKDIIVSRRSILERLQRRQTKDFLRSLTPGQRFKGKVTAVRDFGLFVDIGGIEGLVHQSELSYAFGVKPHTVAKPGDEIDVQVLRIGGEAKRESGKRDRLTRVSLSVKALLPDPWDEHAQAITEGAVHKGKVVRATEFGAFIELVPAIEGLLHITELGRDLKHASQAVREGDEIYVAVERVDRRARRISLSKLSPAEIQEFEAGGLTRDDSSTRNLRQGNNVKLKVERIEPRCVFARVAGTVGKRGRAFIPNSETGTERGTDLRKLFPPGRELEAKIIGIDRDGSLKCSIKALEIDEERQAVKSYRREAAKQGFGTFGDLLRAKLGEAQK
jgi:small subunit ribosomal protein S1